VCLLSMSAHWRVVLLLSVARGGSSLGARHAQEAISVVAAFQAARLDSSWALADLVAGYGDEDDAADSLTIAVGAGDQQPAKSL
jgi:hypothetical protein